MVTTIRPHMRTTAMIPVRYTRVQVLAHGCVAHCVALLLFALLTLASAPILALHLASAVTPDLIDPVHHIWSVASLLHTTLAWRDGLWSFFDGNIFYPTPHAASFADTFVGLLPILLPLTLLTQDPTVLANMLAVLSFVLSAYAAFLLGRELTGDYIAGLVAGLVFGFCPLHAEQIGHVTVVSMQWQALAGYCLVRAWRRPSWLRWSLAGGFLGLSAVTNLYYLAYLTAPLLITAVTLGRAWTSRRLRGAALAGGIAAALTLPMLIPYLSRHADITAYNGAGATDIYWFAQVLSNRPIDGFLMPTTPYQAMQQSHGLFPGILPLILVVIALRARRGRAWGIFALCCGALALGPALIIRGHVLPFPLPYAILSDVVPHFALFRDPTRALAGVYLGIAVLSAWGTHEVIVRTRARTTHGLGVGVIIVGLVALELWTVLPVARLAAIPRGEYWLARQPHIHAIVELPIANATPLDWQHQTEIMRDSTVHWKPMVDGSESLDPVGMARLRSILDTYPSLASRRLLRQLHIDAVVLRLAWLPAQQVDTVKHVCQAAYRDQTEEICVGPWTDAT